MKYNIINFVGHVQLFVAMALIVFSTTGSSDPYFVLGLWGAANIIYSGLDKGASKE